MLRRFLPFLAVLSCGIAAASAATVTYDAAASDGSGRDGTLTVTGDPVSGTSLALVGVQLVLEGTTYTLTNLLGLGAPDASTPYELTIDPAAATVSFGLSTATGVELSSLTLSFAGGYAGPVTAQGLAAYIAGTAILTATATSGDGSLSGLDLAIVTGGEATSVPLPGAAWLFLLGVGAIGTARRRVA